jgi:hypothetical protein
MTDAALPSPAEGEGPGLMEQNLRFALLKAIADAAAKEVGNLRADHLTPLLKRYKAEGTTSYKVRVPGQNGTDVLVATISLAVPKDSIEVTDLDAFTKWAEVNHPDMVHKEFVPGEPERTIVVPATEDRWDVTLAPKKQAAVMKQLTVAEEGVVDPSTGTVVEGVTSVPGRDPNSFAVTYEGDGRDQLAAAYQAGRLDHIVAGSTLPQIAGQRVIVERRLESVPVAPPADPEPVVVTSMEDAFGEDSAVRYGEEDLGAEFSDGYALPGEEEFDLVDASSYGRLNGAPLRPGDPGYRASPARQALEEHADEYAASLAPADDFDPGSF